MPFSEAIFLGYNDVVLVNVLKKVYEYYSFQYLDSAEEAYRPVTADL